MATMTEQQANANSNESRARAEEARKQAERRDYDRRAWLRARALTAGSASR